MRTTEMNKGTEVPRNLATSKSGIQLIRLILVASLFMILGALPASAHCDSYDGPTIKDAIKALETNNVNLVLKWVTLEQEKEIIPLFNKTHQLKSGDKEVYKIGRASCRGRVYI